MQYAAYNMCTEYMNPKTITNAFLGMVTNGYYNAFQIFSSPSDLQPLVTPAGPTALFYITALTETRQCSSLVYAESCNILGVLRWW